MTSSVSPVGDDSGVVNTHCCRPSDAASVPIGHDDEGFLSTLDGNGSGAFVHLDGCVASLGATADQAFAATPRSIDTPPSTDTEARPDG